MTYAEIVLPIALRPLTYNSGGKELCPGMAVMVGIGPRKLCQGIVWRVHSEDPGFKTRPVEKILYEKPLLGERQMKFWRWMADYYMCSPGDVMAAAIPSQLKPEGFSHEEFLEDEFRRTTASYIGLHPSVGNAEKLNEALEGFGRAKAQYTALVELAGLLGEQADDIFAPGLRIPRRALSASGDALNKLVAKELVIVEQLPVSATNLSAENLALPSLTQAQGQALEEIKNDERKTILLHGVTGSGKTEIFIRLAAEAMARGENVLYLLPEIPLSFQLIERLEKVFGERLVAYHSKFTARQRAQIFLELSEGTAEGKIIIGTRTALFLPIDNLGLVIVDEEHDTSFKQDSPAPRFHARDAALVLASLHGAKTVLGSATPSLESYHNALSGKYGLVRLTERYGGVPKPRVVLSDSLRALKRGERNVHFNKMLLDKIASGLDAGSQAIVFQNRRGFSPYVECGGCAWVAHCPDCNVTLTLHKQQGTLRCHYCGYTTPMPRICPSCGQGELLPKGFGTEKVEEELARIFPEARIARLDSDVTGSVRRARGVIEGFSRGDTDILVGTQMVTKGFDFQGVGLVGVVNADNLLNYPDFRASERAFQMLTQAAGRAGRGEQQGEVVIQSSQIEHPVLGQVEAGDYDAMSRSQLAERLAFFYPPYCRLIALTVKHPDKQLCDAAAGHLAGLLRPVFGRRVLGPEPPAVDRIMREHIVLITLKIEKDKSFSEAKNLLSRALETVRTHPDYRKVTIICNVDPQ